MSYLVVPTDTWSGLMFLHSSRKVQCSVIAATNPACSFLQGYSHSVSRTFVMQTTQRSLSSMMLSLSVGDAHMGLWFMQRVTSSYPRTLGHGCCSFMPHGVLWMFVRQSAQKALYYGLFHSAQVMLTWEWGSCNDSPCRSIVLPGASEMLGAATHGHLVRADVPSVLSESTVLCRFGD